MVCLLILTAAAEADPDTGAMLKLFEAFLARLPNCVNRELVDSVSYLLYKVAVALLAYKRIINAVY